MLQYIVVKAKKSLDLMKQFHPKKLNKMDLQRKTQKHHSFHQL